MGKDVPYELILSPLAENDIAELLAWTKYNFGLFAKLKYESLLEHGLWELTKNPEHPRSHPRPDIDEHIRIYHLFHARKLVSDKALQVKRPRHILIYRYSDTTVKIMRVLHEKMDLIRHLPTE